MPPRRANVRGRGNGKWSFPMRDESNIPAKKCTRCRRWLPATTDYFYTHPTGLYDLQSRCKRCYAEMHQEKYAANPDAFRAAARASMARSLERHREEINTRRRAARLSPTTPAAVVLDRWKRKGCRICGETDPVVVEAHHFAPVGRDRNVSGVCDVVRLRVELLKCIPLCANDHRRIHAALRNGHRGAPIDDLIAFLKSRV